MKQSFNSDKVDFSQSVFPVHFTEVTVMSRVWKIAVQVGGVAIRPIVKAELQSSNMLRMRKVSLLSWTATRLYAAVH